MVRKFLGGFGLLAAVLAGVGAVGAADLAVKAPVYKAAPVILSDWAGFYLGVNFGGGWSDTSIDGVTGVPRSSGAVGGGQLGYNWQFGSYVVGVESDLDGASISANGLKTDELGTVRARLGYSILPRLLVYGTAGFAYGQQSVLGTDLGETGYAAGGGVEYKVWGPLSARAEYLHYGLEGNLSGPSIRNDIDVVRGGLNYKF